MAADFWASSHYNRWIVDRATLKQARAEDLQYVDDPQVFDLFAIYTANLISKLGKKLQLRQRVIATATVFFRRFYLKNSYCQTDPFIVIAACCYVAAKAEESPVHIKTVISEARSVFGNGEYGVKNFPTDNSKLAEMEFYLVDDLECDLTIFHPYRTLMALCGKEGSYKNVEAEAGEVGIGIDDGPRYWGTGEGKLLLQEGALQMAWFIINDTYRSDLHLLYPPHLIAIAAIYLTLVIHAATKSSIQPSSTSQPQSQSSRSSPPPRRSSRTSSSNSLKKTPQDIIGFMAGLNVSLPLIATIAQEIISLYTLWDRYKDDKTSLDSARNAISSTSRGSSPFTGMKRTASGAAVIHSSQRSPDHQPSVEDQNNNIIVTPTSLTLMFTRMREARMSDSAHSSCGRPLAVNKMLERTQAIV